MNVHPTTDTAVSAVLSEAVGEVARKAAEHTGCSCCASFTGRPPTPAMFDRLMAMTRHLGYTPSFEPIAETYGPETWLKGQTVGWPFMRVRIDSAMTPAQKFCTFCHEIGHIVLGHNPRNAAMYRQWVSAGRGTDEDPQEEAACELAAAAVGIVAGTSTGTVEAGFIAEKMRKRTIDQDTLDAAKLAARVLWAGLFEHQPVYATAA